MTGWHIRDTRDAVIAGPYTNEEIAELAAAGKVSPGRTQVLHEKHTKSRWVPWEEVPALAKAYKRGERERQDWREAPEEPSEIYGAVAVRETWPRRMLWLMAGAFACVATPFWIAIIAGTIGGPPRRPAPRPVAKIERPTADEKTQKDRETLIGVFQDLGYIYKVEGNSLYVAPQFYLLTIDDKRTVAGVVFLWRNKLPDWPADRYASVPHLRLRDARTGKEVGQVSVLSGFEWY